MRTAVAVLLLAAAAGAQGERPRHNTSYVPEAPEVGEIVLEAVRAAEAGEHARAADRLQALQSARHGSVVAVRGDGRLYVSPARWGALALLAERPPFGPEVLAAWRRAHDVPASTAMRAALAGGDEEAAIDLVERYPAATAAPSVLMALADRAWQRGDVDGALGLLDRVPEHVARSEEALLETEAYAARRRALESAPPREPAGWPTEGGDFTRNRAGAPLPDDLSLLWYAPVLERTPSYFDLARREEPQLVSPRLPFDAVCDEERVYVHAGTAVAAVDRNSGKLLFWAPAESPPRPLLIDAMLQLSPGTRCATVHGGVLYFPRARFGSWLSRTNVLTAFDVARREILWEAGAGASDDEVLARGVFFRGAPAVRHGRVYVYGAAREDGSGEESRKEEAHLFCFRASDGALLWRRFLGYGETDAPPDAPPAGGSSPALSRGVLVAVTNLGVAAALDARTGEVLWLLRYDRQRPRELERLSEQREDRVPVRSSWARQPPRIDGDRVFFAPHDSDEMYGCFLRGRRLPGAEPGAGEFFVERWDPLHRAEGHRNCLLEYFAGVAAGRVFCVGRPDERFLAYESLLSARREDATGFLYGRLPAAVREDGRGVPPEVFGRPAIAGASVFVPTPRVLYRFSLEDLSQESAFAPSHEDPDEPLFGNLVAAGGVLYAVTADGLYAYGAR